MTMLSAALALLLSAALELAPALSSLLSRAAPPVSPGVRPRDSRVSPVQVASAPPQKPVPVEAALPAFTAPAVDDAAQLTQLCLCGSWSLHRRLLSDVATCSVCTRTWMRTGSQVAFVPAVRMREYANSQEALS
jgi:hypothetical protein